MRQCVQSSHESHLRPDALASSAPVSIVLINLDRDADRLAFMRAQLDRLGLPFQRFPAISGADPPAHLQTYFSASARAFLSPGEIGCYASHLAIYEALRDGHIPAPALVLEDDVELPADLAESLSAMIGALPANWDMVRLSSPAKRAYIHVADLPVERALVRYSVSPGSNGAILVSQSGARKFLGGNPPSLPIDQDNRLLWRFGLNLYGVVPAPIRGNALETSSIDDLAEGQSREDEARQRVLRSARQMWRRHFWNIRAFGIGGWLAAEAVGIVAALISKPKRGRFLARASRWLRTASKPA